MMLYANSANSVKNLKALNSYLDFRLEFCEIKALGKLYDDGQDRQNLIR